MSAKELRDLSRTELLELLIQRTGELEQVKAQLEEVLAAQEDSLAAPIVYEHTGTMAEAALRVNGVFEAADRAAKQYQEYMEQMVCRQKEICAQMENEAHEKAEKILLEAEIKSRKIEQDTQVHCTMLLRNAQQEVGRNWEDLFARLERISEENNELRQMVASYDKKRKWSL